MESVHVHTLHPRCHSIGRVNKKKTIHIVEPMERATLAVHAHVVLIGIMRNLVY